ncbi:hypothetical protein [Flavobacterium hungaricum]|uniref:Uncharacterized protein n=1 Tax=Flavobacterium hungaricum TaxID=2082725 RepID=A0ABR9TH91_9FLAO|nr:hypothetical protein [Flavobacterium hungaricum]MBE8724738.1 hypothetical protein [Flavobacterium hungaricum]
MNFSTLIYKSDLQDKEPFSRFSNLKEDEDYYFNEQDGYYKFSVDLEQLVRGNIIDDFYENLEEIDLDKTTIYTFQTLKLNCDDSLLRLFPKVSLLLETIIDFCNKLIYYYENSADKSYFYTLEYENRSATMHRFAADNENYKVDTYDTIDNETDEIELYNYDRKSSQKIALKDKKEITILGHDFVIKKIFFNDKKIERLSKLLDLVEVSKYYKGSSSFIEMDNSF